MPDLLRFTITVFRTFVDKLDHRHQSLKVPHIEFEFSMLSFEDKPNIENKHRIWKARVF